MSKPTPYGRCDVSHEARLVRKTLGYRDSYACDYCWKSPYSHLPARARGRMNCPLLPGSKRKPTKRTKG